ncbi:MAG TPA: DUF2336 domain-containing protein [Pseudolabrys sp.]|nr:DUF2336 domain-containing protein [Pseudolabrys sp.]
MTKPVPPASASAVAADLLELAMEPASGKRFELLRRITDTYLDQRESRTLAEQYLFDELMGQLVDKIDGKDRAHAAAHLATLPSLPHALAQRLAGDDDIAVARPMLRDYGAMPEDILIDVARHASQAHLQAISSREVVTPPVTDIVVDRGDQVTVRTLAANKGARFSRFGMRSLIGKSEKDVALQSLIVDRSDLSLDALGDFISIVSHELAARLREKALDMDVSRIEHHVVDWMEDRKPNAALTTRYIEGIQAGHLKLDDVALELIRGERLFDTLTVLAAVVEADRYFAFGQLARGKVAAVLLLLKSVELKWPVVEAFLKLRRTKILDAMAEAPAVRSDYDAINVADAQRVVRFMKERRPAAAAR